MDAASLVNLLRTTAPSCLCGFRARPAQLPEPFDDNPHSVWKLVCRCGGEQGRFLGYPLRDYNREYDGPEFISPLAFERAACKTVSELLNTDQHGYHAEVARRSGGVGATHYRGQGPRQAFLSPHCGGQKFEVTVGFVF